MAFKQFVLDNHTPVTIYKRKSSRSLRLSIAPDGRVRISIPNWATYSAGLQFARSKQAWIASQHRPVTTLSAGQAIGKAHHLSFLASPTSDKVTGRVKASEIVISHPAALAISSPSVQTVAEATSIRALRTQAEALLPRRLAELAAKHDFSYRTVTVKRLKGRWGSCDVHGDIVLNLFLMQLPWRYIDYVLLHELVHTRVMRHGPDFWQVMTALVPNLPEVRKTMRTYQPVLQRLP